MQPNFQWDSLSSSFTLPATPSDQATLSGSSAQAPQALDPGPPIPYPPVPAGFFRQHPPVPASSGPFMGIDPSLMYNQTPPPFLQESTAQNVVLDANTMHVLRHATTDQLIQAGSQGLAMATTEQLQLVRNNAHMRLIGELNGLNTGFKILSQQVDGIKSKSASQASSPGASVDTPHHNNDQMPIIPDNYDWSDPDRTLHPMTTVWTSHEYKLAIEKDKAAGITQDIKKKPGQNPDLESERVKLRHFGMADGSFIRKMRGRQISSFAHKCFANLDRWGYGKAGFTQLDGRAMAYYQWQMYTQFPYLRLCEGHWKLHKIGTQEYPGFREKTRTWAVKEEEKVMKLDNMTSPSISLSVEESHATATKRRLIAIEKSLTGGFKKRKVLPGDENSVSNTELKSPISVAENVQILTTPADVPVPVAPDPPLTTAPTDIPVPAAPNPPLTTPTTKDSVDSGPIKTPAGSAEIAAPLLITNPLDKHTKENEVLPLPAKKKANKKKDQVAAKPKRQSTRSKQHKTVTGSITTDEASKTTPVVSEDTLFTFSSTSHDEVNLFGEIYLKLHRNEKPTVGEITATYNALSAEDKQPWEQQANELRQAAGGKKKRGRPAAGKK